MSARRGVPIEDLVAAHEALHQLDDDASIGVGEEGADAQRDVAADLVDAIVGDAVFQDVLQDALSFVGDGRPLEVVDQRELASGRWSEWRRAERSDGLRLVVRVATRRIVAGHGDGLHQVGQAAGLQGDAIAIELDDGWHPGGGRVARLAGADLADIRDLAGGLDGHRGDVAFLHFVQPREQVDAEHEGEQ